VLFFAWAVLVIAIVLILGIPTERAGDPSIRTDVGRAGIALAPSVPTGGSR